MNKKIAEYLLEGFVSIIVIGCFLGMIASLKCKKYAEAASWAEATGSLAAVLVALFKTFTDEKQEKIESLKGEIQLLSSLYFGLKNADLYSSNELKQPEGSTIYFNFWQDYKYSLNSLRDILRKNGEYNAASTVDKFIGFLNNDKNKERRLNSRLSWPLGKFFKIVEKKQKQLDELISN